MTLDFGDDAGIKFFLLQTLILIGLRITPLWAWWPGHVPTQYYFCSELSRSGCFSDKMSPTRDISLVKCNVLGKVQEQLSEVGR